jgi:putative DNA primase/helicase
MILTQNGLRGAAPSLTDLADPNPYTAAQALAALGLPVFPLHTVDRDGRCSCGRDCGRNTGKHPRTRNGLLDATLDAARIRSLWRTWPEANVAVATGAAAGIWVVDIDPDKGGLESFEQLEVVNGDVSLTWCVETGGDGLHLWFACDEVVLRNSVGRIGAGLDVRGEGGYVIVPPSRHESGLSYRWAPGWHPARVDLSPAPPWLVDLARQASQPKMIPPDGPPIEGGVGGNHFLPRATAISEGARNSTLTSLAGSMRRKGFSEEAILAALRVDNAKHCDPPLPDAEIARIARSVSRYDPAVGGVGHRRSSPAKTFVEFINGKAVAR